MRSKTLIMHHVEAMWQPGIELRGKDYEEYLMSILRFIKEEQFDQVINTRFEDPCVCGSFMYIYDEVDWLTEYIDVVYAYAYGWDLDDRDESYKKIGNTYVTEYNEIYIDGGLHSPHVLVPEWIDNHISDNVTLIGAFDRECIDDMETLLRFKGINYQRNNNYIV